MTEDRLCSSPTAPAGAVAGKASRASIVPTPAEHASTLPGPAGAARSPPSPASSPECGRLVIASPTSEDRSSSRSCSPSESSLRDSGWSPTMGRSPVAPPEGDVRDSHADQVAPSTSPERDEQVEEEEEAATWQRGGGRRAFSKEQLSMMRRAYNSTPYPGREQYVKIAEDTGVDAKSLKLWFQNRRAKARKRPTSPTTTSDLYTTESRDEPLGAAASTSEEEEPESSEVDEEAEDSARQSDEEEARLTFSGAPRECPPRVAGAPVEYQPMTVVALPPDHPFCQLLPQHPNMRRSRRGANSRGQGAAEACSQSPVARPAHARGRSATLGGRKNPTQRVAPPVADLHPSPGGDSIDPKASLWRPIGLDGSGARGRESPLDLSVSMKRKRSAKRSPPADGISGNASKKRDTATVESKQQVAMSQPLLVPGSFPYYPAGAPAYLPIAMPQVPYQMGPFPLGMYGQPVWTPPYHPGLSHSQKIA